MLEGSTSTPTANVNGDTHTGTQDTVDMTEVNTWHVPIAICGIGLRLPGGIRTPSELFDLLVNVINFFEWYLNNFELQNQIQQIKQRF